MDSLERLSHSLEQAVALIHSLRRENRDLAKQASAAIASAKEDASSGLDQMALELAAAKSEISRLKNEPSEDLISVERARQAELEAARLAEEMEALRRSQLDEKRALEERLGLLELKLLAAEREETMPISRAPEIEELTQRSAALEQALAEKETELERSKGAITSLQVKIAESANPDEVGHWQEKIRSLEAEVAELQALRELKASLDEERQELRRQKKALGHIKKEREQVKAKLDEIYGTLENLRLS